MLTLTRQIIKDVVAEEVRTSTDEIRGDVKKLDKKIDTVITQLTDIAGQFKKFDEEQTVFGIAAI